MDKQPISQFYTENESLIHFASQKALKRFAAAGLGDRIEYEEIFGNLTEVFLKSYQQFDPERSKFSTYFVTACHNFITDRMSKMFRVEMKTDSANAMAEMRSEDGDDNMDELFDTDPMLEDEVALLSEVNYMRQNLSPFARILFDYSVNPPQFIIDEFRAQRAQCSLASSIGLKTNHSTEIDLHFIANCLKGTAQNPETVKHLKRAVDEVKHAVLQAVSA